MKNVLIFALLLFAAGVFAQSASFSISGRAQYIPKTVVNQVGGK